MVQRQAEVFTKRLEYTVMVFWGAHVVHVEMPLLEEHWQAERDCLAAHWRPERNWSSMGALGTQQVQDWLVFTALVLQPQVDGVTGALVMGFLGYLELAQLQVQLKTVTLTHWRYVWFTIVVTGVVVDGREVKFWYIAGIAETGFARQLVRFWVTFHPQDIVEGWYVQTALA